MEIIGTVIGALLILLFLGLIVLAVGLPGLVLLAWAFSGVGGTALAIVILLWAFNDK